MISARDALGLLRDGNRRFVADVRSRENLPSRARRVELAAGQAPFAAILGCSDSRVPVEIVFDQGLGDLFVIRVAGVQPPRTHRQVDRTHEQPVIEEPLSSQVGPQVVTSRTARDSVAASEIPLVLRIG